MGADRIGFRTETEQLALDGIQLEGGIQLLREHLVERFLKPASGGELVNRDVLEPVGHPHIGDAGLVQLLAEVGADPPGSLAVIDPEPANVRIRMAQREAVLGLVMGEAGGIKIQPRPCSLAQTTQRSKWRGSSSSRSTRSSVSA